MKRKILLGCAAVLALGLLGGASLIAGTKRIYVCEQGYDPPCRYVGSADADVSPPDNPEWFAVERAFLSGLDSPVIRTKYDYLLACGPNHGQSACCRIIADVNGKRYIECGN